MSCNKFLFSFCGLVSFHVSGIKINMNGQPMGLMLYLVKICSDVMEEILGKLNVKQHNFKTLARIYL